MGPGHGITHKDRLIVPIWFACNREKEKSHHPSFISTLYSADAGKSWQLGDVIFPNDLKNPSECALAVTKEDEVLISIRHEGASRTRALAKSADGTSGWYGLRFEEALPDPICMGSMTQKSGRIYHINCDSTQGRTNLTLTVSDDAFQTCKKIPISKEGGYADIALLGNKLFVFYEKTLDSDAEDRKWKPFLLYFDEIAL